MAKNNEEKSQAIARLGICLAAIIYLGFLWVFKGARYETNFMVVGSYALFSFGWLLIVRRFPGNYFFRRLIVIFSDLGINTFFMYSLGPFGAFFYPIYLWIIVGNGVRFGPKFLLWAQSVGLIYFLGVLMTPGFWNQNQTIGWALFLGILILPTFYLKLVSGLHQVNRNLEVELQRSQAATLAKTEFLANMSHELRTPMNGILGFANLLMKSGLKKEQLQQVGYIQQSTQDLLHIIEEILDFSKIGANRLRLEQVPIDLAQIQQEVISLMEPTAKEKDLTFSCKTQDGLSTRFMGDPIRIKQILYNLIGNAIKFTEKGRVEVVCNHRPLDRQRVAFTWVISDTGIGIQSGKLKLIFEQFEQADTRLGRRFGGTGLGLAISKRLAHMMDGEIEVQSELGKGSTFTLNLILEIAPPQKTEKPIESKPITRAYGLSALIVEDNRINQKVAKGLLAQIGVKSDLTDNGEDALTLIGSNQYDLVFMDMQMPVMDGLEATKRVRQMKTSKNRVPIIALTANTTDFDRNICFDSGMDGHVCKPLTVPALIQQIDALQNSGRISKKPIDSANPP